MITQKAHPIPMQPRHEAALALLNSWASDPKAGLPYELFLFVSRLVPMVNVDLLISDEQGRILLTWRDDEIHGAGWHVPGGMIRYKETAGKRIRDTALEELGAEVSFDATPVIEQMIEPDREIRGHCLSLIYSCRLISGPAESLQFKGGQPERGQWEWHARYPENMIAAHRHYRRFFKS